MKQYDVLVLGAGLAGSLAALKCAQAGLSVALVTKGDGASRWSQGGIVYRSEGDPQALIEDIVKAGCGLNNLEAVKLVAHKGPRLVKEWLIDELGVPFDLAPLSQIGPKADFLSHQREDVCSSNDNFDLCLEAAHSRHRILHIQDQTGRGISAKLQERVAAHPRIEILYGTLVDLLSSTRHDCRAQSVYSSPRIAGAYVFLQANSEVVALEARATILATGGYSRLYQHSTGPESSRGDGISAAQRAGARVMHMEYVQFHPTALYVPGHPRYLLTEALRGQGAKLLNLQGKSFVNELAPRDVVARAIQHEILRSGPGSHVWLDLRGLSKLDHFTGILEILSQHHIDPSRECVPVVPAAHYTLGGVWTDTKGRTTVPGLYAAGEVACTGLHGSNRLASTSLLECVVFGIEAATEVIEELKHLRVNFQAQPWRCESEAVDTALVQQDWDLLGQTMWHYVGLIRSTNRLKRAESTLNHLRSEVESFYAHGELSDGLIGLRHSVLVANLVLYAALRNKVSSGTHFVTEDR